MKLREEKQLRFYHLVLLGLFLLGIHPVNSLFALSEREKQKAESNGCVWGGIGERTTYQKPYSPILDPEIPIIEKTDPNELSKRELPMSPEEAISVIGSNGSRYSYYFKKDKGWKKITEWQTVYEPCEQLCDQEIEVIDPITGEIRYQTVTVTEMTPYPVLHEEEVVRYEPTDVLIRVIILNDPALDNAVTTQTPDGATTHIEQSVPQN